MAARRSKAPGERKDERKEESLRVRVSTEEKEAWTRAAKRDGRTVSSWLRFIANREADAGKA